MTAATWHAHRADGQPLSALVGHRRVDGRLEQTFLDSAVLDIQANGHWQQRSYLQTWRDGQRAGAPAVGTHGTWAPSDGGYVFTPAVGTHRFVIRDPTADSLALVLAIPGLPGLVAATLRPAPAPPLLTGGWRATGVGGHGLPHVVEVFDPDTVDGRAVSIHIRADSARLDLAPTGRYHHRVHFSEWEGSVGGPPHTLRFRFTHSDFGAWTRTGTVVRFESGWLQNHRMEGTFVNGVLHVQHGLQAGDPRLPFRYDR